MKKRISAFVIDDIVISLFFMIIFYDQIMGLLSTAEAGGEISQATMELMSTFLSENIIIVLAIKVIYHTVLVWQNGMTIGKYMLKIKVISLDTEQRPTFQQAFLRASVRLISDTFFYLGYIMAFFTPMKQTLHDKLSRCVVVYA
jgi:uncharacterized RDD family membrane protein YckC